MGLGLGLQRDTQCVGVDDAGLGRPQRRRATHVGLETLRGGGVEQLEAAGAVAKALRVQPLEDANLRLVAGHDELADAPMPDPPLSAPRVQLLAPAHAELRLEAIRWIVEAGVHHLAVAAGDAASDAVLALQDDHGTPGSRQRGRRREPDDPRADHHDVDVTQAAPSRSQAGPLESRPDQNAYPNSASKRLRISSSPSSMLCGPGRATLSEPIRLPMRAPVSIGRPRAIA